MTIKRTLEFLTVDPEGDKPEPGKVVLTYGPAGYRFHKRDQFKQWKNMMGGHVNAIPLMFAYLPKPPKVMK